MHSSSRGVICLTGCLKNSPGKKSNLLVAFLFLLKIDATWPVAFFLFEKLMQPGNILEMFCYAGNYLTVLHRMEKIRNSLHTLLTRKRHEFKI